MNKTNIQKQRQFESQRKKAQIKLATVLTKYEMRPTSMFPPNRASIETKLNWKKQIANLENTIAMYTRKIEALHSGQQV